MQCDNCELFIAPVISLKYVNVNYASWSTFLIAFCFGVHPPPWQNANITVPALIYNKLQDKREITTSIIRNDSKNKFDEQTI